MDYGSRKKMRKTGRMKLALGGGLAVCVGVAGSLLLAGGLRDRDLAIAEAKTVALAGPPCPTVTAAGALAGVLRANETFQYYDMHLSRAFGHVSCDMIGYDAGRGWGKYPLCQFTSPGLLHITTPGQDIYYATGIGRPATVSLPHGVLRCVMASKVRRLSLSTPRPPDIAPRRARQGRRRNGRRRPARP